MRFQSVGNRDSWLAWSQLLRIPNHFTALADILAGFVFARGDLQPMKLLIPLWLASWSLYAAGMVLNDVFDLGRDRQQRPRRPLPSSRISVSTARAVGWTLLLVGVLCSFLASSVHDDTTWMRGRATIVAAVLAVLIVLYNGPLKATFLGPLAMGSCRAANLLLGMSAGWPSAGAAWWGFEPAELAIALAMGVYVAGVTLFARDEAGDPRRSKLIVGVGVISAGLVLLACVFRFEPFASGRRSMPFVNAMVWPGLMALIGFSIVRRGLSAAVSAEPVRIQAAVKHMILSIVVLDAAITLAGGAWAVAILVLSLLIPVIVLGKVVYST